MKTTEEISGRYSEAVDDTYNYDRFRLGFYDLDRFGGPEVGDEAPDFIAETTSGYEASLSDYRGSPVVLVTGSYTTPQYIDKIETMNRISRRHPEAISLTLYVREAHPGEKAPAHRNLEDKRKLAQRTVTEDGERAEILVDDLNGSAHQKYGGLPNMSYVIDEKGMVLAREAWNSPRVVEKALDRLVRGESLGNIRAGFVPVSPVTVMRVLNRAGRYALGDVLVALPELVAKDLFASIKEVRRPF